MKYAIDDYSFQPYDYNLPFNKSITSRFSYIRLKQFIMETLPLFHIKVLQILGGRYGISCNLEELASLLTPVINASAAISDNMCTEKEKQAKVLDALIVLNDEGYVFLDSITDKTTITIKGLIKVNYTFFLN